ncbi:dehydroquinate dehydratase, putative / shikimate dehydrogenase isoform X2 [Wolffia australiana]
MAGMNNETMVCVPTVAKTVDQMLNDVGRAKAAGADVVEIRLDHLATFSPRRDLETLLKGRLLPFIITYRPKWEGGEYEGDDNERLDVLRLAMEMGADYVDVELKVAHEFVESISEKKPDNFKLIVSSHNYESTPSLETLGDLVARIQAVGADIVKIATFATDISDVARMFRIIVHRQRQVPIIGLVMGERGVISRILCPKFGGFLTFAILDGGKESAPGQPTITELLNLYRIRDIRCDTKVYGIIGKPVGHSKSPLLHNGAFKSSGINAVYVPLLVDDLAQFLSVFSAPDFAGFSVTIPHKEAAVKCCDEVDPIAKSIGAVNTIFRRPSDGKLLGYNTDYTGAISAIEDAITGSTGKNSTVSSLSGKLFVVIGAGGAGKALAYGAKEKGARVIIGNRTLDRARELAELVGGDALSLAELENFRPEDGAIVANTTSIGMHPAVNDTPLSKEALKHYSVVFDAVYTPRVTRFLREAKEAGAAIVSGLEMFIRQAIGQYEIFTGLNAPEEVIRETLERVA